jgi:ribosome-binding factor A
MSSDDQRRRPERVAESILREVAEMLQREIKDPRLRGVTLTRAEMSSDLHHCRIFFSHLEGSSQAARTQAGFERAGGFIRQHIRRLLALRITPELSFHFDSGPENAAHIDSLLRRAERKH